MLSRTNRPIARRNPLCGRRRKPKTVCRLLPRQQIAPGPMIATGRNRTDPVRYAAHRLIPKIRWA